MASEQCAGGPVSGRTMNHRKDPNVTWTPRIKMARGRFITNANVDDRLAPDCYETHAHFLDAFPEVDLVYSDSYITRIPNETFELNLLPRGSN